MSLCLGECLVSLSVLMPLAALCPAARATQGLPALWVLQLICPTLTLCKQSPVQESLAFMTASHKSFKMFMHLEV